MKKNLLLSLFFINTMTVFACPTFYFHLTFSGTRTFIIQNMSNPTESINVTGTNSIDAWDFSGSLGNPCGITFGSNVCYSIEEVTTHLSTDEKIAIKFTGANPNHLTIAYNGTLRTFTVTNSGNTNAYNLTWGNVSNSPPHCCMTDVLISGIYTIPLTESSTWIINLGSTIIPTSATVKLDADPINGYIQLDDEFEVQLGAVFIAQVLDGCGSAIPMKVMPSVDINPVPVKSKIKAVIQPVKKDIKTLPQKK